MICQSWMDGAVVGAAMVCGTVVIGGFAVVIMMLKAEGQLRADRRRRKEQPRK